MFHHFSLLEDDGEDKLIAGMCKAIYQSLEASCEYCQSSIVGEEGFPDGDMPHLGLGSEFGQILYAGRLYLRFC